MAASSESDTQLQALAEHLAAAASDPRRYLSANDVDDIEEAFADTDANEDGVVTREEFEQTLDEFPLPDEEAAAIREALAGHEGEGVSLDAVMVMRAQAKLRGRAEVVRRSFESVDTDRSGSLDIDELAKFMAETGSGDVQAERDRLLAAIDADGNSEISFDEFLRYNLNLSYPKVV